MFTVMIIPADEAQPITSSDFADEPQLEALQKIVGGYIEQVPMWSDYLGIPCAVYCNEEGKLHHLPINQRATMLWRAKLRMPGALADVLVGPVVLVIETEEKPS
jgi:hypothetical protein